MRRLFWIVIGAATMLVLLAGGGVAYVKAFAHGFSANAQPTAVEAFAANEAREIALPEDARNKQNPVPASEEVLAEAREHWADHCAACHANDGSGAIPLGQHMYPPAPDMRKAGTQKKTDGELFYIVQNGIRLTGCRRGEREQSTMYKIPGNSCDSSVTCRSLPPTSNSKWRA